MLSLQFAKLLIDYGLTTLWVTVRAIPAGGKMMSPEEKTEAKKLVTELLHHMGPEVWILLVQPDYQIVTQGRDPEEDSRARCEMVKTKLKRLEQLLGKSPS